MQSTFSLQKYSSSLNNEISHHFLIFISQLVFFLLPSFIFDFFSPLSLAKKKKITRKHNFRDERKFNDAKRGRFRSFVESTPRVISEKCNGKEESYERAGREYRAIIPSDKAIPLHSRNYVSAI